MAKPTYDPTRTGLLLVDPYNDFLSEGGKLPRDNQGETPATIRMRTRLGGVGEGRSS